jgi:hypothetical protein
MLKDFNWKFEKSERIEWLTHGNVNKGLELLSQWVNFFPKEFTWVEANYHVPSIIVRLDCVFWDHVLYLYEIEERPAGIGLSYYLNSQFKSKLVGLKRKWPPFKSLISFNRKENDDRLWLQVLDLKEAEKDDCLLLVRAEPSEKDFYVFQNRSVSTLRTKGDKSYGEKMGLWREVSFSDFEEFPWEDGFCLKPKQGSKCKGIHIWNSELKNKVMGVSTRGQIERTINEFEKMYLQEYISPIMFELNRRKLYMNYKIFFGYDPIQGDYICLGGVWVARPSLKIHGATDAVIGLIKIKE